MTPQELKSSILQLAFQGKLVEQRTEEGTGEELFLQIQAERQAMIKADRIKKEKHTLQSTKMKFPLISLKRGFGQGYKILCTTEDRKYQTRHFVI